MNIGKLSIFTQKWLLACKKTFESDLGTWEVFILYLLDLFSDRENAPEELKQRLDYYGRFRDQYNPEFFKISEKEFQFYKKSDRIELSK